MKHWIDVSMSIEPEMMVYKNKTEKKPKIITRASHKTHSHHESAIEMDLHTGTHVDMPLHMIAGGDNSDDFDVSRINGNAVVIDFSKSTLKGIGEDFLKKHSISAHEIVILKTKNSFAQTFDFEFDFLDQTGARYLADIGVKAVAIDALGIERSQEGHPTHKILMQSGIYIIEGLVLKDIPAGHYDFMCLPLKIKGVEGLPARAFLKPLV